MKHFAQNFVEKIATPVFPVIGKAANVGYYTALVEETVIEKDDDLEAYCAGYNAKFQSMLDQLA
jgi:hypothetical protein